MAGVAALVVAVVGAGASYEQNRKSASQQREARRMERGRQLAEEAENRRQQIRQERIRRAQIVQMAENTGGAGSSGVTTAVGSLSTQTGANLAFRQGQTDTSLAISDKMQQSATSALRGQQIQAGTSLLTSGLDAYSSIFDTPETPKTPQQQP